MKRLEEMFEGARAVFEIVLSRIWSTKNREALINDDREKVIRMPLHNSCETLGIVIYAVGMVSDHIHVAISIPPKIAVATAIGRIKGASSFAVRSQNDGRVQFSWQGEYGVISLTEKAMPTVTNYVQNQRERHSQGDLIERLERIN